MTQDSIGQYSAGQGLTFSLLLCNFSGLSGIELGYGGTCPGMATEFDSHSDAWDPVSSHVGVVIGVSGGAGLLLSHQPAA